MRYPSPLALPVLLALSLSGCGGLELNPLTSEHRAIRSERDRAKTVTLVHELVMEDKRHATHELRLPAGSYSLEGEDEEYWYMRSPGPLVLRDLHGGGKTEEHNLHGGIALGKYPTRSVPAAAYIDGEATAKILIWKLGKNFMGGEGRDWRKSF